VKIIIIFKFINKSKPSMNNKRKFKSASSASSARSAINIRVLCGGMSIVSNPQRQPFFDAFIQVQKELSESYELTMEEKSCRDIKDLNWTAEETVDWLMGSDIYAITCHPHQGLDSLGWDMDDLAMQMEKLGLSGCIGCPDKRQIDCPIWSQNKFGYLVLLRNFCCSTLKVPLRDLESHDFSHSEQKFIFETFQKFKTVDKTEATTRGGVTVKAPYATGDS
jgi:hypothetical protein